MKDLDYYFGWKDCLVWLQDKASKGSLEEIITLEMEVVEKKIEEVMNDIGIQFLKDSNENKAAKRSV
jgi:hypothetical protein